MGFENSSSTSSCLLYFFLRFQELTLISWNYDFVTVVIKVSLFGYSAYHWTSEEVSTLALYRDTPTKYSCIDSSLQWHCSTCTKYNCMDRGGRVVWWQLNGQREPNPAENVDICFPTMESCHRRGSQRSRSEIRTTCQGISPISSEYLWIQK